MKSIYFCAIATIITSLTSGILATFALQPAQADTDNDALQQAYCQQDWDTAYAIASGYAATSSDAANKQQWQTYANRMQEYKNGIYAPAAAEIVAMGCNAAGQTAVGINDSISNDGSNCSITTSSGETVALNDICNQPRTYQPAPSYRSPSNTTSYPSSNTNSSTRSTSSSRSGNCQYAWQRDSAGRRCGGRAASEKPGGN